MPMLELGQSDQGLERKIRKEGIIIKWGEYCTGPAKSLNSELLCL